MMLMVEAAEGPQHQACRGEVEAGGHSWGCQLHSWMAAEGWQAGPAMCCHFCLLEVVGGGGLICLAGPSLEEGVSRWAGEEEGPNVPLTVREVQRT